MSELWAQMESVKTTIALAVFLALTLTGCAAAPIEKAQAKVVEIGTAYLNYDMTDQEACDALESILVPGTEGNGPIYLKGDIAELQLMIIAADLGEYTYEEIQDKVDRIRKNKYTD